MPRIAIVFAASFLLLASPVLVLAVTAPQNLNVVPISSCAFNISWIHNQQSGDRYDVKRDSVLITGVGVSTTGNQHSFRDLNQYWLTVIDPSTTHAYEVRAFNTVSGEGSDYTSLFSATTNALPTTPGSPQNLVVTEASAGVIKLDWNNGSPVSTLFSDYGGFLVERAVSTDGGANFGDFVKIDRIPASNSFYNDGVFDVFSTNYPSISYKYRVLTQEVGGEGCNPDRSAHTVVSLPSSEVVVPPAPTNLTGTFNGQSREITLRWQDNSLNEVRFELERSLSSSFAAGQTTVVASNISANTTSYVDAITDPTPQNYYYRLRSCTATACSFFSNSASVSSGVLAPTNLTAGIVSISGLTANTFIKWEGEILENTTYLIERADSSRNFTEIAQVSAATVASQNKTFYDNNVPLHDNYYYRVRVRTSGGGLSAYSNEATLDLNILYVVKGLAWSGLSEPLPPPPDTTAPAVSITSPDNNATVSGSVTISATASDNIGVRQVQFLLNNTNFGSPITNPPYRLSWDTTSVPNGSHIISAEALDEAGNSGSASVTITVDNPPLPPPPPPPANAPSDLRVTSFSSTEVGLAWTDNSTDETFFEIWRQDVGPSGSVVSDQPWVRVAIVGESVTSYLDTGLVSDYIYYYKVRACNTGGCSLYSNEEGVVTSSSGGSGGGPACTSNEDCRPNEVCIPPDGYETLSVGSVWIGHCTPIGVQEEQ